jgi:nicotinamidase-related amidase
MMKTNANPTPRTTCLGPVIPRRAALLLVDVQEGFDDPRWGTRNNPEAEVRMAQLLAAWRDQGLPVIHIQHCSTDPESPLRPDLPGAALKAATGPWPGEPVIQKQVNSAFIQTPLEAHLERQDISALVVVGLSTDHCVSTTVRMAGNLGFTVFLVSDATAAFDREGLDGCRYPAEAIHQIHLASLHREFCTVLTCSEVLAGLEGQYLPPESTPHSQRLQLSLPHPADSFAAPLLEVSPWIEPSQD